MKDGGVAVEINANGLRRSSWLSERPDLGTQPKRYELTAIISSDAHDPRNLVDGAVRQAEQLAADWGITVTPKLTF